MGLTEFDARYGHFVFFLVVLAFSFLVALILKFMIGRFVRISSTKLKVDPTKLKFFKNAVYFIVYLTAAIVIFKSIPSLNSLGNGLLASAGVLAAIVGLASQSAFSNIISGIFLVIFRPFSVGDRVKVGQLYVGDVEDITLRHTVIRDFENKRIVIPNTVISNETILNSSIPGEYLCVFVEMNIALHTTDIDKAMRIMQQQAEAHPLHVDNRTPEEKKKGEPVVVVRLLQFTDSAMTLRAWVWTTDPTNAFILKCDLLKSIKQAFDKEGIEVPYPHRMVFLQNQNEIRS